MRWGAFLAAIPKGACWRTLDDDGRPQYRGDLYSNGGIPLFLAHYHRLTGNGRALELGIAGAKWCAAPDRVFLADRSGGGWDLIGGRTGVALAWLSLARASGDPALLDRATQVPTALRERDPGSITGFSAGEAGVGVFLLRLWEQTRDPRHLAAATRRAAWLLEHAVRRDSGEAGLAGTEGTCFWTFRIDEPRQAA